MKKGIIGKKLGMTQIFDEKGNVIPVTLIEAGPCVVAQKKTVENDGYNALQLAYECLARNIEFLPVDFKKSDSFKFLPENGKIRLPFSSIAGVGDNAAEKIAGARDSGEIFSVEDFQQKTSLSKTVIQVLKDNGVFNDMSETNQISMF